jgi:DNA-binding XRE family transcriptional regulator
MLKLQLERERREMERADVCKAIGGLIKPSTLYNIEKGSQGMSKRVAAALSSLFGISKDELLQEVNK